MKFIYYNNSTKKHKFHLIIIALIIISSINSLRNKLSFSTFKNKKNFNNSLYNKNTNNVRKTLVTSKSTFNWLIKENQKWSAAEISFNKKSEAFKLNVEINLHKKGIFFVINKETELETIQTSLKNYILYHPIDGKESYLIDFSNLSNCDFEILQNEFKFKLRIFGGTENTKYCKAIPISISKLSNNILNSIQQIKEACLARKEEMRKYAFTFILEERKENFFNEELLKNSKYKADIDQINVLQNQIEKIKKIKELKNKIFDENKNLINEITDTVKDETSKQKILPQEVHLLGPKIVVPKLNINLNNNFLLSISALQVILPKGNAVFVSDFKKQNFKNLSTINDEKKGYLVANINYNLLPIKKVEFTISIVTKDVESLSKPIECKSEADIDMNRNMSDAEKNIFYMKPSFNCPEIVNGRDYDLDY